VNYCQEKLTMKNGLKVLEGQKKTPQKFFSRMRNYRMVVRRCPGAVLRGSEKKLL
jgi:hypothetical protein